MIRIAIAVSIQAVNGDEIVTEGAAASAYMVLDEEDFWNMRHEDVLSRLLGQAREAYNLGEGIEDQIPR